MIISMVIMIFMLVIIITKITLPFISFHHRSCNILLIIIILIIKMVMILILTMIKMVTLKILARYDETNAMRNTGGGAPPLPNKKKVRT